jgi:hypothetical protein
MGLGFSQIRAGDLNLIPEVRVDGETFYLQRRESDSRIDSLRKDWDETLVGVLEVHCLTDHPDTPGIAHLGDGGCRWRVIIEAEEPNLDYLFHCTIEDLTIRESAHRFLGRNKNRKAVAKLDEYRIALTDRQEWALAIEMALEPLDLVIDRFPHYGNGQPGKVAAVAGCEQIVAAAERRFGSWTAAAAHLEQLLTLTRRAFHGVTVTEQNDSAYAHDGDLIRAMSRVMLHPENAPLFAGRTAQDRMVEKLGSHSASWWKRTAAEKSASRAATPGTGGRPAYLAALIVYEYNKRLRTGRLANPNPRIDYGIAEV